MKKLKKSRILHLFFFAVCQHNNHLIPNLVASHTGSMSNFRSYISLNNLHVETEGPAEIQQKYWLPWAFTGHFFEKYQCTMN